MRELECLGIGVQNSSTAVLNAIRMVMCCRSLSESFDIELSDMRDFAEFARTPAYLYITQHLERVL